MEIISTNQAIILGIIVAVVIMIKFLLKKNPSVGGNTVYVQKNAPHAQDNYDQERADKGEPKLSIADRLELSWQFLYEITDIVLSKFSIEDQDAALNLGKSLLQNGGRYEHVIDYGIRHSLGRSENKSGTAKGV